MISPLPRGAGAALLLLATATLAPADGLYGLSGASADGPIGLLAPPEDSSALGYDVSADEFPAFGGFRVQGLEGHAAPVVAMPGMVFRTHLHLAARKTLGPGVLVPRPEESLLTRHLPDWLAGRPGVEAGMLPVSRPLGSFSFGAERDYLRSVMVKDALRATPTAERPALKGALAQADLTDVLLRRLEDATAKLQGGSGSPRELGFQIQTEDGARRRSLLFYHAVEDYQDGRFWWVVKFYDPHFGAGEEARLSRLRMHVGDDGAVALQVQTAWARAANFEPGPPAEAATPGAGSTSAGWTTLRFDQLFLLDDTTLGWDAEYLATAEDQQVHERNLQRSSSPFPGRGRLAGHGATPEDWLGGNLEEGAFDEVAPGDELGGT